MSEETSEQKNIEGLSALYSGVLQNLVMVQAADNAVEGKMIGIAGLSLAAIALIADKTHTWQGLSVLGAGLLVAALALAFLCLRIRNYHSATVSIKEHPGYMTKDSKALLEQLISDAETSYTDAESKLSDKADLYQWAIKAFIAGSLISIASFHFKLISI